MSDPEAKQRGGPTQRVSFRGSQIELEEASRLVRTPTLVGLAASSCFVLIGMIASNHRDVTLGGVALLTTVLGLLLLRLGRPALAALGLALGGLGLAVTTVTTGKGVHDVGLVLFPLIIVIGNLVFSRAAALAFGWLTALTGSLVGVAEVLGIVTTELSHLTTRSNPLELFLMLGVVNLVAGHLVKMLARARDDANAEAQGYAEIFNATSEAIFIHDAKTGEYLDANRAALKMGPYERDELIGKKFDQVLDPDGAKIAFSMIRNVERGGRRIFSWKSVDKQGKERTNEVSLQRARLRGRQVVLAVMRDLSEIQEMRERIAQGEKLQVVGQLAGGVAHDFNNQLTGILANADLLAIELEGDERLQQCINAIIQCTNRSADLTAQLLAFARRGKHQNITVDIHTLIDEVVALLERSIDKRISIQLDLTKSKALVRGDPTLLQNALLNLALNARDAMPDGGVLTFRTDHQPLAPKKQRPKDGARSSVIIEVDDTGHGMEEATRRRVFEPFFSTKASGNGMGLAAVYGAIESHGGDISVESAPGAGTTFRIELPCTEQPSHASQRLLKATESHSQLEGVRVLLAEDEPEVARIAARLLRQFGCHVTLATNGNEAAAELERPDAFDVAILDQVMPGQSGRQVLAKLRLAGSNLPCILTSGFINDAVVSDQEETAFLPKPYSRRGLQTALLEVLVTSEAVRGAGA